MIYELALADECSVFQDRRIRNRKSQIEIRNSIHVVYGSKAMNRARLMALLAFLWQPAQLPLRLRE
jgi:hypothetical protein